MQLYRQVKSGLFAKGERLVYPTPVEVHWLPDLSLRARTSVTVNAWGLPGYNCRTVRRSLICGESWYEFRGVSLRNSMRRAFRS